MTTWTRIAWSVVGTAIGGIVMFFGMLFLSVATDSCDRAVHVCDMSVIGGIGLGMFTSPIGAFVGGRLAWRRTGRRGREPTPAAASNAGVAPRS